MENSDYQKIFKLALCKKTGETFGVFYNNDKFIIDNGEQEFIYDTPDDLLADWVETLIEQHIAANKYYVTVVKSETFAIDANTEDDAIETAFFLAKEASTELSTSCTEYKISKCIKKSECDWSAEINYIYEEIIKKLPRYISAIRGRDKSKFKAEVYRNNGNPHGEMVYLGTFEYIVDAIIAIRQYKAERKEI